jgi:hypothetical protein
MKYQRDDMLYPYKKCLDRENCAKCKWSDGQPGVKLFCDIASTSIGYVSENITIYYCDHPNKIDAPYEETERCGCCGRILDERGI